MAPHLLKKFPTFYGTLRLIPCSQELTTCPDPEPDQTRPCPFLKVHFNIIIPSMFRSSKWFVPSDFTTKPLYVFFFSPVHHPYPAHLIFLDWIIHIIFGEKYKSWSLYLCNFLQSPVASYLLGPNSVLSTTFSNTTSSYSALNDALLFTLT